MDDVYVALAAEMGSALAKAMGTPSACTWLHEKHHRSVFRSVAGPLNVHATATHVHTPFNVAADALLTTSSDRFRAMMHNLSSDFVSGDVLRTVVAPSAEAPNRHVALKTAVFKTDKLFQKDKSFVYLEYVDVVQVGSRRVAFRALQSIATPEDGSNQERSMAPLTGLVFASTPHADQIEVSYLCSLRHDVDASYVISHVEQCFAGVFKHLDEARALPVQLVLPQLQIIDLPEATAKRCHVCARAFLWGTNAACCCKCGQVYALVLPIALLAVKVCGHCMSTQRVQVAAANLPEREAAVCLRCMDSARRKKSQDLVAAPSVDLDGHFGRMQALWTTYELPTKETAYRPPVRKLSFPFRSTSDSLLASFKKRRGSMVDLVCPPIALSRTVSEPGDNNYNLRSVSM
ncbi:hypothetical protein ACHHYP_08493 [Achlya hypogyna]|uniref:FYVE-type domain-containing protein n=1 Tax=Achlya hypogyna TaxID=1202772 RepID=A0A1V9YPA4_ACHHY|nr:hypothetical protein ACHHYP_08493 [Achlya hypogyna]